jgi:hypothetical protein
MSRHSGMPGLSLSWRRALGVFPGPGPTLPEDRGPLLQVGTAAEGRQVLGLLLDPFGPEGRVGGIEDLGRVNPRALWTPGGPVPKVAMSTGAFLGTSWWP